MDFINLNLITSILSKIIKVARAYNGPYSCKLIKFENVTDSISNFWTIQSGFDFFFFFFENPIISFIHQDKNNNVNRLLIYINATGDSLINYHIKMLPMMKQKLNYDKIFMSLFFSRYVKI